MRDSDDVLCNNAALVVQIDNSRDERRSYLQQDVSVCIEMHCYFSGFYSNILWCFIKKRKERNIAMAVRQGWNMCCQ